MINRYHTTFWKIAVSREYWMNYRGFLIIWLLPHSLSTLLWASCLSCSLQVCRRSSLLRGGDETNHWVDRVPGFLSSRPNWLSSTPHPQAIVSPAPCGSKGGDTLACERWGGGANSGEVSIWYSIIHTSQILRQREAWCSINHSILSGSKRFYFKIGFGRD